MNRHIKFLQYLKQIGGDIEEKNITKKLFKLGLRNENHVHDFLESLKQKGFLEWYDHRPRVSDRSNSSVVFIGGFPDENAPLHYTAKLLLTGIEHLDERAIKTGQNKWLIVSIVVAAALGLLSAYLSYSNNEKDIEIRTLKKDLESSLKTSNQQIGKLNTELANTKKALQFHIEQKSKTPVAAPPSRKKQ